MTKLAKFLIVTSACGFLCLTATGETWQIDAKRSTILAIIPPDGPLQDLGLVSVFRLGGFKHRVRWNTNSLAQIKLDMTFPVQGIEVYDQLMSHKVLERLRYRGMLGEQPTRLSGNDREAIRRFVVSRPFLDAERHPLVRLSLSKLRLKRQRKLARGQRQYAFAARALLRIKGRQRAQDFDAIVTTYPGEIVRVETFGKVPLPPFGVKRFRIFFGLLSSEQHAHVYARLILKRSGRR